MIILIYYLMTLVTYAKFTYSHEFKINEKVLFLSEDSFKRTRGNIFYYSFNYYVSECQRIFIVIAHQ